MTTPSPRAGFATFRQEALGGRIMAGTFLKTPAYEVVEVLARSSLDFVCLDAEHAPFDRARMDACLAIARALDFPAMVRVGAAEPHLILQALDAGAVGVVCPHVATPEIAEDVAKAARFGRGGRGFAGSTRWAGFATRPMNEILDQADETMVLAQIEEPEGVEAAAAIAATPGIDGLFLGPADLSVGYGKTDQTSDELKLALESVGKATQSAGKCYVSWVPNATKAAEWRNFGMSMFFVASEHAWMLAGANTVASGIHEI
jgi:2-keto-3-deoxy-L-rhamnonate aldolase RhmA